MANTGSDDRSNFTTTTTDTRRSRAKGSFPVSKPSRRRVLQLLLNLYCQKDHWKKYGGLRTCCRNSLIISPVQIWWWMAQVFVLATVVVFTYEFFSLNWLAILPSVIVAFLELMAFYKTCLKDPGVLPRPDFVTAFRNLIRVLASWGEGSDTHTRRFVIFPGGANEQLTYCWKCHHYRAISTYHCVICDCCMIQHDHHCYVFGGCVAKYNVSSFHTMIISMVWFWVYTFAVCIYNMAITTKSFVRWTDSTHNADGDYALAARITFYIIIGEMFAVLILSNIIACCIKLKNKNDHDPPAMEIQHLAEEILRFAQENNFPEEEVVQLREILQVGDEIQVTDLTLGTNDLNDNYYIGPIAPTV